MSFRLVPKSVLLNDLERRNGRYLRYFSEFGSFRGTLRKSGWRCRRKKSSRSLSRFLWSFLYHSGYQIRGQWLAKALVSLPDSIAVRRGTARLFFFVVCELFLLALATFGLWSAHSDKCIFGSTLVMKPNADKIDWSWCVVLAYFITFSG